MIANCHQHTRFLRPADNRKYPECLPVFQEQANECAAFFRQEIAKCSGDAGGMKSADTTHGVITIPEGIAFPGWRYEGPMRAGKPHGRGTITNLKSPPGHTKKGEVEYHDGILHGRTVITYKRSGDAHNPAYWSRTTMDYRNGKLHGRYLVESSTGRRCGRYENGNVIGAC